MRIVFIAVSDCGKQPLWNGSRDFGAKTISDGAAIRFRYGARRNSEQIFVACGNLSQQFLFTPRDERILT